jgi:uncharacterized protein
MMSVELSRTASMLKKSSGKMTSESDAAQILSLAENLSTRSKIIRDGIFKHAVVNHPVYGEVFAYEIDGYGSHLLMDDANIPSLLSLPLLGFIEPSDPIYQNTRRMILSPRGNPYFLTGAKFQGIGGPHIGLRNAWPMSVLVQALTSTNDTEILECIERVKEVSVFGLINESVDVQRGVRRSNGEGMTRSWFAWANSVFAQAVLRVAEERPGILFEDAGQGYKVGKGWVDVKQE